MINLLSFFSVESIFFTVLGYPMSYIEFFGTIANVLSVWLMVKKNIFTWPVGIVGVVLFLWLFYQINLYSDMIEQVYFLLTSIWGWWMWQQTKSTQPDEVITVEETSIKEHVTTLITTLLGTFALWQVTLSLPRMLPNIFFNPPSYALLDALTTMMSFTATYLMMKRKFSCWYYWIIVDVIGIGLYYAKDVKFLSLLYALFLVLAIQGLLSWKRSVHPPVALSEV